MEMASDRRVVGNTTTFVLVGNIAVFFILRNSERMKVKGNKPIGMVMQRPRKRGFWTVGRPHCSNFPLWVAYP